VRLLVTFAGTVPMDFADDADEEVIVRQAEAALASGSLTFDLAVSALDAVCRVCGCTEEEACEGGCAWAEPDLCTACVEKESV
jgi:hypothetical protein